MSIHLVANVTKNTLHEFFSAHHFIESSKNFLIRNKNCAFFF